MTDLFLTNMTFFLFHKMLIDGLEWWVLHVDYCDQLFGLSFWRHPFTAEDPLVSKWYNANFSKSVLMKKQTHLHLRCPEGE